LAGALEKAGVGGSIPSLATTSKSTTYWIWSKAPSTVEAFDLYANSFI